MCEEEVKETKKLTLREKIVEIKNAAGSFLSSQICLRMFTAIVVFPTDGLAAKRTRFPGRIDTKQSRSRKPKDNESTPSPL